MPTSASTGTCACNRDTTIDESCKCCPHAKKARNQAFLDGLNQTFRDSSITTCLRKAHFLAQVGAESGELRDVSEILPKGVAGEKKGIAKPVAAERKAGYQRYLDLRVPIDAAQAARPKHPPLHPKAATRSSR